MKKFFAIIAIVAMSVFVSEAYGQTPAKSCAEQVKEAYELIRKAVNEKNGDTLVQGLEAYTASFDSVNSFEEFQEIYTKYDLQTVLKEDPSSWVNKEQEERIIKLDIEGAVNKALKRLMGGLE